MVKKLLFGFIVFAVSLTIMMPPSAFANHHKVPDLAKQSLSAILIERDTGHVLFEKESNKELPPASMTKIMTMLLIMEALDEKKISLQDQVRASKHAASMGGSQIFLEEGEEMTVEDLLKGVAIASANDASVALAEYIAGSEEVFVEMMNERAKELGLKNTHFVNSTGLPAKNHYSSAHDMAMMAKELLKHEEITRYTSIYEDYLREDSDNKFWLVNTNRLVKFYPGVDGLKTGYTSEAKYCLTATAKKGNMRTIAVVMGAPTPKDRNRQISEMLDYAFNRFTVHNIYDSGEEIRQVKVSKGNKSHLTVLTGDKISILTEKGESIENVKPKIEMKSTVSAPIKKGETVGKLVLEKDGEILSETPLLSAEDVEKASVWQMFKRMMAQFAAKSD